MRLRQLLLLLLFNPTVKLVLKSFRSQRRNKWFGGPEPTSITLCLHSVGNNSLFPPACCRPPGRAHFLQWLLAASSQG